MACSTEPQLYLAENDTGPSINGTFTGVDITSYTITLHIGYATPVSIVASIVDGPAGTFRFDFSAGNLQKGNWPAQIETDDGSGTEITFWKDSNGDPLTIEITERIVP
jgi:hypothetical protein